MSNKISVETEKSEKFLKSLKCRIYPTEAQKVMIEKSFGCLRLAYNEHLQEKTEFYINNILPVKNTTTKEEKSEIYKIVKADRYFPSSQICHCYGYQNHALTLNDRAWTCPNCNTHLDRDHNAAINLKNYKIPAKHRESTSVETENKTLETLATIALELGAVDEAETENREISDKKAERL